MRALCQVVGGYTSEEDEENTTPGGCLLSYNVAADTWTSGACMTSPRADACAAVVAGKLYVAGVPFSCAFWISVPTSPSLHSNKVVLSLQSHFVSFNDRRENRWLCIHDLLGVPDLLLRQIQEALLAALHDLPQGRCLRSRGSWQAVCYRCRPPCSVWRAGACTCTCTCTPSIFEVVCRWEHG